MNVIDKCGVVLIFSTLAIVLFLIVCIPLSLIFVGDKYDKSDLEIWDICRMSAKNSSSQDATELQRSQVISPLQDEMSGEKVTFIGRVVDVRMNPMDGVYVILKTPLSKEDGDTDVYAFFPIQYNSHPLPDELFKRDVVKVYGQYSGFCEPVKDKYLLNIIMEKVIILRRHK